MPVKNTSTVTEKRGRISTTVAERKMGYPENWHEIANRIKAKHNWCCERCGAPHDPSAGRCLTVHHLDGNRENSADWNLAALDQACHLAIQGRVKMDQGFFDSILPVSDWFLPHWKGYLRSKSANVCMSHGGHK